MGITRTALIRFMSLFAILFFVAIVATIYLNTASNSEKKKDLPPLERQIFDLLEDNSEGLSEANIASQLDVENYVTNSEFRLAFSSLRGKRTIQEIHLSPDESVFRLCCFLNVLGTPMNNGEGTPISGIDLWMLTTTPYHPSYHVDISPTPPN